MYLRTRLRMRAAKPRRSMSHPSPFGWGGLLAEERAGSDHEKLDTVAAGVPAEAGSSSLKRSAFATAQRSPKRVRQQYQIGNDSQRARAGEHAE